GTVERHAVPSAALGAPRETWVYVPPGADAGAPLAVAVLLDGDVWGDAIPIAPTLDALIAARAIPPTCALMPHSLDGETREREMAMGDAHVRFLADELLPWAATRWPVTEDPARTVIAGQSMGGLGAAYAGLVAPARFGGVLAQSGSYWWPEDDDGTAHERIVGWVDDLQAPPTARFWMEVGRHEWMLLGTNRRMRDALRAAGADVTFREFGGGHDYACWRGGLADGLVALLGAG
ncbi:alpha/beta hydrolase, partial [Patulibacter sp. S7RM1-6]